MERELNYIENCLKNGDLTSGLEHLQRLLHKSKSNHTSLQIILERLYQLSQVLMKQRTFQSIFPLFQVLLKLCNLVENTARLCDIKNSLSFCYRSSGQINLALKECLEALELAGEHKSLIFKLPALHLNACAIYKEDIKDLAIAKTHAELAYYFAKENCSAIGKDKRTLAVTYFNYASLLEESKESQTALIWYKEGLKFCEEEWDDVYMEQMFREKVSVLNYPAQRKPGKKTGSQRPVKRFIAVRGRPLGYKKERKGFSLTPASNRTLPVHSFHREKTSFYQDIDNEIKGKKSFITSSSSVKTKGAYSESSRNIKKNNLSLVQCVVKIQKWYRKLFGKGAKLKFDYVFFTCKTFFGVKYFVSVYKACQKPAGFVAEAWPLVRRIKKPEAVSISLSQMNELIGKKMDKEAAFRMKHAVEVRDNRIELVKVMEIYEGSRLISGKEYDVLILYHGRCLEIQAALREERLYCMLKLDPLHDLEDIKKKVNIVVENLDIKSGELVFNFM